MRQASEGRDTLGVRPEKNSGLRVKKVCTVNCGSFTMQCMVASSIPCKLSLCADRSHACAGDSHTSSGIDVACPTTQNVLAIASPHELHGDSWPSSSTGTSSFCCIQQYSVTAVTTSTGAVAERYAYTAYGQPTILDASASVLSSSAIINRYTYTGREWDATLALHHSRARWMSAIAGRFLSRDPIGYEGSEWGLYEFATSRTFTRLDPSGLTCCIFSWLTSSTGHSALKCGPAPENYPSYGSYYSMYPDGPHLESDDRKNGPPSSVICIDCLNEMAISSKWLQIEHQRYCMVGGNCSSYIGQLLDAGIVSSDSSKACPSSPPCPRCQEDVGCHNSCAGSIRGGIPGPDLPSNALSYFKCLKNVNCDPWVRACRRDPNFDYGPKY